MSCYTAPDSHRRNKITIELDVSNYTTYSKLKKGTGFDMAEFAKKVDLSGLKSEEDNQDIGKLKTAPTDLKKLSNIPDNDVAETTTYFKLV